MRDEHVRLWHVVSDQLPNLGPRTGPFRHYTNARAAARLIDQLSDESVHPPLTPVARQQWQASVQCRVQAFGGERLGWPAGYRRLLFGDAFVAAAVDFSRAAHAFDPGLPLDDLWQALRNVWIGNSCQMLLDLPVRSTAALFAYSMLYPLTDNLLDNPAVDAAAKRAFNERFRRRLAGLPASPVNAAEAAVFELVAMIERQFPRHRCADVYDSLLAIHHGQTLSLLQHDEIAQDAERLLAISCEKGGTSVLADLYLVAGQASPEQERFAFGFGVALQLMDDLQDADRDAAAGHQTIFTRAAAAGHLDAPTAKLLQLIDRVLGVGDGSPRRHAGVAGARPAAAPGEGRTLDDRPFDVRQLDGEPLDDRLDLLRRNCRGLVVGSVAAQPRLFSAPFRRAVARQSPFSLGGLRRLRRRAQLRLPPDRLLALLAAETTPAAWSA